MENIETTLIQSSEGHEDKVFRFNVINNGEPLAIPTNPNLPNSSSRTPADTRPAFNPEAFKTKPPLWSEKLPQQGYLIC